ncbi:MAG: arsenate reductase ArsC [Thermoplasmatales archaeon]|nr:MAG: arsenate reductase ArsC [Thermoplasmatales archaeon]
MKKVLFVCIENTCRSQMAQGFFNKFASNAFADSAGTQPSDQVDSKATIVMKKVGINIGQNKPKMLTSSMNNEFDYIISMGCIDSCPIPPRDKTIEWNIEDPKGKSVDKYREIRDKIRTQVEQLIEEKFIS